MKIANFAGKFSISIVLFVIAFLIFQNLMTYFGFGGFKGGIGSNVLVVLFHVLGISVCMAAIVGVVLAKNPFGD